MTNQEEKTPVDCEQAKSGVVIGVLLGLSDDGVPLVAYSGGAEGQVLARTTVSFRPSDIGSKVALLFEDSDWKKPLVIGRLLVSAEEQRAEPKTTTASIDGRSLHLTADREVVLKCGKASITLTRAGKIIIRGEYVLSRSTGANRIKGAAVQIN